MTDTDAKLDELRKKVLEDATGCVLTPPSQGREPLKRHIRDLDALIAHARALGPDGPCRNEWHHQHHETGERCPACNGYGPWEAAPPPPDDAELVRLRDAVHEAILDLAKDFDDDKAWWDQERINAPLTAYGDARDARGRALGRVEGLREVAHLRNDGGEIADLLAEAEAALG